eukprot:TRINITY_DN3146_c0_g1_i2.p1 TRINITY_DN3146_c0_g1~~TRINITY_DN3146_c0_g1_i2.p1  ORF type:complete len:408 (-),score=91.16 TRINITY_DN3146_c0_g1_i2:429-1652(-)
MSLMYAAALHQVADQNDVFDVLDFTDFDSEYTSWMTSQHERLEIIMQWIQRLIIDCHRSGVIDVAPPILSRVYQELSNGMIDVSNAKRIKSYPFPFAYAQMISLLLFWHFFASVAIGGMAMENPLTAAAFAFTSVLSVWSVNYIAIEIEMPYGSDPNDLPLHWMQRSMNDSLMNLLHPLSQSVPAMVQKGDDRDKTVLTVTWELKEDFRVGEMDAEGGCTYVVVDPSDEHARKTYRSFAPTKPPAPAPAPPAPAPPAPAAPPPPAPEPLIKVAPLCALNAMQKQVEIALADQCDRQRQTLALEIRELRNILLAGMNGDAATCFARSSITSPPEPVQALEDECRAPPLFASPPQALDYSVGGPSKTLLLARLEARHRANLTDASTTNASAEAEDLISPDAVAVETPVS